ncbi:hypothetical protein DFJ74DRAFT_645488 [Hyaloraphidium curvatum]|nr:hypothetical protein DFJ74DRAFT_645488 [Hyaloraphidium curvatum]
MKRPRYQLAKHGNSARGAPDHDGRRAAAALLFLGFAFALAPAASATRTAARSSSTRYWESVDVPDPATGAPSCRMLSGDNAYGSYLERWTYCPGRCNPPGTDSAMLNGNPYNPNPQTTLIQTTCPPDADNGAAGPNRTVGYIEYRLIGGECYLRAVEEVLGRPLTTGTAHNTGYRFMAPCPIDYARELPGFVLAPPNSTALARIDVPQLGVGDAAFGCVSAAIYKYLREPPGHIDNLGGNFHCIDDPIGLRGAQIAVKRTGLGDAACVSLDEHSCAVMTRECCLHMIWSGTRAYSEEIKRRDAVVPYLPCAHYLDGLRGQPSYAGALRRCTAAVAFLDSNPSHIKPALGHASMLGDNCTVRNAFNAAGVPDPGASPWFYFKFPYNDYGAVHRNASDGSVSCLVDPDPSQGGPTTCIRFDEALATCGMNVAASAGPRAPWRTFMLANISNPWPPNNPAEVVQPVPAPSPTPVWQADWIAAAQGGTQGSWTCVRSCREKGNSVRIFLNSSGPVQCLGPDAKRCSWYTGSGSCSELAPGETPPDASERVGYECRPEEVQAEGSWCAAARDALLGRPPEPCSLSLASTGRRRAVWPPYISLALMYAAAIVTAR